MAVNPSKTQISLGIRPVWSESSLSAWRKLGSLATHWAHSIDSDQTGWMPGLIWVFAGRTATLLVLSCRGSFGLLLRSHTYITNKFTSPVLVMHKTRIVASSYTCIFEPWHDKTNKMAVRLAKTQIRLGIRPVWSVFTVRMKKFWVLSYPLNAQRRLWSDWADAQADLSLRWAHTHFVGFVMSWLICRTCSLIFETISV